MDNMYNSIVTGLKEAIEYEKGNLKGVRRRVVKVLPLPNYSAEDIKAIRVTLNLSQSSFADLMGVSSKTVEAWESGKNTPYGPAQRMLQLLKNDYKLVEKYVVGN